MKKVCNRFSTLGTYKQTIKLKSKFYFSRFFPFQILSLFTMPRNYKNKKQKNYDEALLQTALAETASGFMTVGKAAKQFGVPKETLRRQTQSGQPFRLGSGRQAVLTPVKENHIAVALD